jgi:POT family proton-dependent oligopeptide transporter
LTPSPKRQKIVGPLVRQEDPVSLASRFAQFRSGFSSTFWIANGLELFERFAYYGSKAVLAVYVAEQVGLGPEAAGWLVGSLFNTLLYLLPLLAGAVVDRFGFKRSLLACFAIFSVGYFLIGLAALPAGQVLVDTVGRKVYMVLALVLTAAGGSLIKPSIVGTVARTTTDATKSLGYSIYYTLVNVGGAIGPFLAVLVRQNLGIAYVLIMSSATTFVLILATLLFFKEPPRPKEALPATSFAKVLRDAMMVFGNLRFMSFLVVFSGFWIMFWQIFYSLPFYVRDVLKFERFEIFETIDAWTIILVTVLATALAKKLRPILAMTLGFALATTSWFLMIATPPAWAQVAAAPVVAVMNLVLATLALLGLPATTMALTPAIAPAAFGLMVFAVGEALQAPRYYEYVADLAPKEQVGTYMGFAFLPIAIGTFVAGAISGKLVTHFIQGPGAAAPERMWIVIGLIGVVSTILMVLYDRLVARRPTAR